MAVTKIRKISSWTLLLCSIITVAVLGIFFFGGIENPGEENPRPVYTNLLLNWTYIIFFASLISTLIFALWQLITSFKNDAKGALMGIGAIIAFAVIMFIGYSIADGTPLLGLNAESQVHNTPGWLKITDMWIYTTYILIGLILVAVVAGSVKKILNK